MTRRETLLKFSGITGVPVLLGSCNMDNVRTAEANLGWRMKRPGTGVQFSGIPEVVKVIILATYPATPQQTQVAESRARKAVTTIAKREGKHVAAKHTTPEKHTTGKHTAVQKGQDSGEKPATVVGGGTTGGGGAVAATPVEEAKAAAVVLQQESGSSIIAVDTQPDNRLQGSRAVMLWNTSSQRLVGNNVYDVSSPPAKGQVAQWGSVTARYVGSGGL